jgi:hypothetical protein
MFEFPYLLERHKNNKIPCNAIKKSTECKLCNINFPCAAKLETHNKTKKHINTQNAYNIQIANTINNNFNIHNHITVVRGFSETNINVISLKDIEYLLSCEDKINYYIKLFEEDPYDVYYDSTFIVIIFKYFIKIFAKLNFNLAYSENHNCLIFSFSKSSLDFIEYQLLEIDNTHDNYYKKCIEFEIFIEEFINLMKKINNKYPNETFLYLLNYVNRYKYMIFKPNSLSKVTIENELLTSYNEFELSKNKVRTEEEEFQYALMTARNNAFKHLIKN